MAIDDVLTYTSNYCWSLYGKPPPEDPVYRDRYGQSRRNDAERRRRFDLLMKVMRQSAEVERRVRIQILVYGISPGIDRGGEVFKQLGLENDTVIPPEGLILYPVAVRAPSGHNSQLEPGDVKLNSALLSYPLNDRVVYAIPMAFFTSHPQGTSKGSTKKV